MKTSRSNNHRNPSARDLANDILAQPGVVMLIGGVNTGKSFLAHRLAAEIVKAGMRCAIVDGDIGQSSLGPPAAVSLALFTGRVPANLSRVRPDCLRFIGSTSPAGFLVQTLTAVKSLVEVALRADAETVIVDTTGFIEGEVAREFKFQKISLVNPRHLITLARDSELDDIVNPFAARKDMTIHRLRPDPAVRIRNQSEREAYRSKMFKYYFGGSVLKEVNLQNFCLQGRIPVFPADKLKGLLMAFCDPYQNASLGIIRSYSPRRNALKVFTPLRSLKNINSIRFGIVRISFI